MSKIVLFFMIIALVYTNAQDLDKAQEPNKAEDLTKGQDLNTAQAAAAAGVPTFLGMLIPNFSPEDLINAAAKPGQDIHATYVSQTSQGGKTVTTLRRNDNGVVKEQQLTN